MTMIRAMALLIVCLMLGEILNRVVGMPLPGSVIGMLLLLCWLAFVQRERPTLNAVTGWLTAHLAIMFVPAAVGLVQEGDVLRDYGVGIVVATAISTVLTLVVTVTVFRWALRFIHDEEPATSGDGA